MAPHSAPVLEDDVLTQLLTDLPPALMALAIPSFLMYLSFWALAKKWKGIFVILSLPTLVGFWQGGVAAPVRCAALKALLRFTGTYIEIVKEFGGVLFEGCRGASRSETEQVLQPEAVAIEIFILPAILYAWG